MPSPSRIGCSLAVEHSDRARSSRGRGGPPGHVHSFGLGCCGSARTSWHALGHIWVSENSAKAQNETRPDSPLGTIELPAPSRRPSPRSPTYGVQAVPQPARRRQVVDRLPPAPGPRRHRTQLLPLRRLLRPRRTRRFRRARNHLLDRWRPTSPGSAPTAVVSTVEADVQHAEAGHFEETSWTTCWTSALPVRGAQGDAQAIRDG